MGSQKLKFIQLIQAVRDGLREYTKSTRPQRPELEENGPMSNENLPTEQIRQRLEEGGLCLLVGSGCCLLLPASSTPSLFFPSLRSWTKRRRECFFKCC